VISSDLILDIMGILAAAWILGYLFTRIGLSAILGQLLAGLILGPPVLGWITITPQLQFMADMGIFFIMFYTGMVMNPKELIEHLRPVLATAAAGFVLPYVLGYIVTRAFGGTELQALFIGLCISITAVALQSAVLESMRINRSETGHIIIGAAIASQILALIGLALLLGLVHTGTITALDVTFLLLKVGAFFGLTLILGYFVIPRISIRVTDKGGFGFTFALTIALAMGYLAHLAGLHVVIGAFFAGQFVRRELMDDAVYLAISDRVYSIAYGFLLPIFFFSLSAHLHIAWDLNFLAFAAALTVAAYGGKFFGAGAAVRLFGRSTREAVVVGFGMNGRGEVELVLASLIIEQSLILTEAGRIGAPLLTEVQFGALILLAFATKISAPLTMHWSVRRSCRPDEYASFCRLLDEAE